MKRIIFLFAMMVSFASFSNLQDVDSGNVLILQGSLYEGDCATIELFQFDEVSQDWILLEQQECLSHYFYCLSPTKEYKIVFTHDSGYSKTAVIEAGERGVWSLRMDVDFNKSVITHAYIRQICGDGDDPISYRKEIVKV